MKICCLSTIFVVLCVVVSVSASNSNSTNAGEDGDVHPNINLSMLELINNLAPGSNELNVLGDFQATEAPIPPGKSYIVVVGGEKQSCWFLWDPYCAKCVVFDPNEDLGHHNVFWSVRADGIYHSWDKVHWAKKYKWEPGSDCN